jgi:hypothetical protein
LEQAAVAAAVAGHFPEFRPVRAACSLTDYLSSAAQAASCPVVWLDGVIQAEWRGLMERV